MKITYEQIGKMARRLGLKRGKGTYNGSPYWLRQGSSTVITPARVLELAGY